MPPTSFRRAAFIRLAALVLMTASLGVRAAPAQDTALVVVKNFMFSPMSLTIKAGSTVTWKNLDDEPHEVVSDTGLFRSRALDQDDTYQFRFDKPGTYTIFCGIHPAMKQTIVVQ